LKGLSASLWNGLIGEKPCPPIILGIGLGGSADLVLKLAKKSLLRPLGVGHENEKIAQLEREILKEVNALGIGPMGMGGRTTALDVKIELCSQTSSFSPGWVNNSVLGT